MQKPLVSNKHDSNIAGNRGFTLVVTVSLLESIDWDKDWRCRNWIQAPPFYFGSAMYASENDRNLHTQRLNSYVVNFGPTSSKSPYPSARPARP